MGLSERFSLIHAVQQRVKGSHGSGRQPMGSGRPDQRKNTLQGMISKHGQREGARAGRRKQGGPGSSNQPGASSRKKAVFQAELVARVAAASGPAHAAESWGQAGWHTPTATARKLDLSTGERSAGTGRGAGKGGKGKSGKGKGKGGKGKGGKGRGHQLAIKWQRPPSAEEQAELEAAAGTRREAMDDDLDEYWSQQAQVPMQVPA